MKKNFLSGLITGLLLTGLAGIANATPFSYSFAVGSGTSIKINLLSGPQTALEFYDYYDFSGHPSFGTEKSTAFFWLWQDTNTNKLSLNVIFNKPGAGGTGGKADFILSGLPTGWAWTLKDDDDGYNIVGPNDLTPTWAWLWAYTDGGIIEGLEDSEWTIDWTVQSTSNNLAGITSWYFLSADASKTSKPFSLAPGSTLKINAAPVPEPATMILMGTGLIGLAGVIRKKKA